MVTVKRRTAREKESTHFWISILKKRIEEFFKDSDFCKLIRKGKERMKNTVGRKIHDIYHRLDYKSFLLPGGFLTETFNTSFTVSTDGVNKFSSSHAGHLNCGLSILRLMNFLRSNASKRNQSSYQRICTETNMIQTC